MEEQVRGRCRWRNAGQSKAVSNDSALRRNGRLIRFEYVTVRT